MSATYCCRGFDSRPVAGMTDAIKLLYDAVGERARFEFRKEPEYRYDRRENNGAFGR